MALNIVLFEPEIPNNTGNIGRLSLAVGARLHLVKPFGFELSDKRVKRAGLDYWQHLDLSTYENVDEFFQVNKDKKMAFLTSHGTKSYCDIPFEEDFFVVFGKESSGLNKEVVNAYPNQLYKIPMASEHIRSINLANAVGIVMYEGVRQMS